MQKNISLSEAYGLVLKEAISYGSEYVSIDKVCGRVLAEDIIADRDYPPFDRAAMDGIAIKLDDFEPNKLNNPM